MSLNSSWINRSIWMMSKLPQMTFEILNSEILILHIGKTLVSLPLLFVIFWLLKKLGKFFYRRESKKTADSFLLTRSGDYSEFAFVCNVLPVSWTCLKASLSKKHKSLKSLSVANLDEAAQNTKAWIVLLWQSEQISKVSFNLSCPACLKTCLKASLSRRSTLWKAQGLPVIFCTL